MVTGEPSKRSGLSFIQLVEGEILKQQAHHVKLLGLWLGGHSLAVLRWGPLSLAGERLMVFGLSFENELLAVGQWQVPNLTLASYFGFVPNMLCITLKFEVA